MGIAIVGGKLAGAAAAVAKQAITARNYLTRTVTDNKLMGRIDRMYRSNAKHGTGSTADGLRHELATGLNLSKTGHTQKATEMVNGLQKDINSGRLNQVDDAVARGLQYDLQQAIVGK